MRQRATSCLETFPCVHYSATGNLTLYFLRLSDLSSSKIGRLTQSLGAAQFYFCWVNDLALYFDLVCLRLLGLGQFDRENAILVLGRNFTLGHRAGQCD